MGGGAHRLGRMGARRAGAAYYGPGTLLLRLSVVARPLPGPPAGPGLGGGYGPRWAAPLHRAIPRPGRSRHGWHVPEPHAGLGAAGHPQSRAARRPLIAGAG